MKNYYLTSIWKYYSLLSGSIIFWSIIGLIAYQHKYFDFVLPLTILGIVGTVLGIYNAQTSRLVISEMGVEWFSLGFVFSTRWQYITKVSHHLYGISIQEGFIVDNMMVHFRKWSIGNLPNPLGHIPRIRPFIPLSCFAENWRDTELGQQIKQYAPHQFEKEKSA